MTTVAIAGTPGSPGATSTALALLLTWPLPPGRRVLLAECDPDGGAVLPGALQGRIEGSWGLRNLAVADRRGMLAQVLWEQLIDLSPEERGDRLLLPGVTDPAQTPGLAYTWEPLSRLFSGWHTHAVDVIADLGRHGALAGPAPVARRADAVLVVVRATLRGVAAAQPRIAALREELDAKGTGSAALAAVLVAEGPYAPAEVARELGVPVAGVLPFAPAQARVLSDGHGEASDRRFVRSELMRSARSLADEVRRLSEERRALLARPDDGRSRAARAVRDDGAESAIPGGAPAPATAAPMPPRPAPPATFGTFETPVNGASSDSVPGFGRGVAGHAR